MVMHTPVDYWLSLSRVELDAWVRTTARIAPRES